MKAIPRKGSWIMIIKMIPVEIPIEPFSIFFAVPNKKLTFSNELAGWNFGEDKIGEYSDYFALDHFGNWDGVKRAFHDLSRGKAEKNYTKEQLRFLYKHEDNVDIEEQMTVLTPHGEVCIQPNEYTIVDDIQKYIEPVKTEHAFIHYLTKEKTLKGKVQEQVFYLQTRGIGYADALMMVTQNIRTPHLFYITMHEEYQRMYFRDYDQFLEKKKAFELKVKAA